MNLAALGEDAESARRGVEAFVRTSFLHDDRSYEMVRRLYGIVDQDDNILEEERGVELSVTDGSGNTEFLGGGDEDRINREINGILDTRVKNYFLFDGERIERLTKVTEQQKAEVALGIKNLLKIDELFKVGNALKGLEIKLTRELKKVSTGAYKKKLQEKEKLMGKQNGLASEVERLERELLVAQGQVRDLDLELEKFKDNAGLILKRKEERTSGEVSKRR